MTISSAFSSSFIFNIYFGLRMKEKERKREREREREREMEWRTPPDATGF